MGTSTPIRQLDDRATLVASSSTWMEDEALRQLRRAGALDDVIRAVGMPDLHPGKGAPNGAIVITEGRLYPHLVGSDIGCGMALFQTDIPVRRLRLDRLEKKLRKRRAISTEEVGHRVAQEGLEPTPHDARLGTIGGGNHFAEIQVVDSIFEAGAVEALGLEPAAALLLVHSGSRGLGEAIHRDHVAHCGARGLEVQSAQGQTYLQSHDQAMRWAELNRRLIAESVLRAIGARGERLTDHHHNFAEPCGESQWLHRKGAVPADRGPLVVAGSRGARSWIVTPREIRDDLGRSVAHGAGRKWKRADCRGRLERRFTRAQLGRTALGSRVIVEDRDLLYEEAPQAYKSITSVIDDLAAAHLCESMASLRPVLTLKA